jgi:hypothetical protein
MHITQKNTFVNGGLSFQINSPVLSDEGPWTFAITSIIGDEELIEKKLNVKIAGQQPILISIDDVKIYTTRLKYCMR